MTDQLLASQKYNTWWKTSFEVNTHAFILLLLKCPWAGWLRTLGVLYNTFMNYPIQGLWYHGSPDELYLQHNPELLGRSYFFKCNILLYRLVFMYMHLIFNTNERCSLFFLLDWRKRSKVWFTKWRLVTVYCITLLYAHHTKEIQLKYTWVDTN